MDALPVGATRIWTHTVRNQVRRERVIKVSHHGSKWQRWRPAARHWWETNIQKIALGYKVTHLDGDSLNDSPDNLRLVREEHFRLIFARDPKAQKRQVSRRAKGVAKSNQRRGRIESAQINPKRFYAVLPASGAVVWIPCCSRAGVELALAKHDLTALCEQSYLALSRKHLPVYQTGDPIQIVQGKQLMLNSQSDGKYEGFIRLIPDERRVPRKRVPKSGNSDFADSQPHQ